MAYDRLLQRLYLLDRDWIIKGATALLARDIAVRATIDIDVYRNTTADRAERELREAAARDIGDWFRFEVGPRHAVSTQPAAFVCPSAHTSAPRYGRRSTSTLRAPS
jgi:hypothetical protein